jgi:hypothetical protein
MFLCQAGVRMRAVHSVGRAVTTHKFLLLCCCHYDLALWVNQLCLVVKVLTTDFYPLQHVGLGRERELTVVQ